MSCIEPAIGSGQATPIVPGLLWLRMPLDSKLAAINVWAIEEKDGWSVVDTGLRSPGTVAAWRCAAEEALGGKPIHRIFVTHMHPDHSGMSGWLCARYKAKLWMAPLEYLTLHMLATDTGRAPPEDAIEFYRIAGMDETWLDGYRTRFGEFGKMLYPLPVQFRSLGEGDRISIGDHEWQVVIGRGHSPEHACLYSSDLKLFISGDQVLPTISSNISVHPYEPDADPLTQWLATLRDIRDAVPDDVLVLPAHGQPFRGLHARIDKLISGHEEGLSRLIQLISTPKRACDVYGALFRSVGEDPQVQMMAVGEALAHLHCLRSRGLAKAVEDESGVLLWGRA